MTNKINFKDRDTLSMLREAVQHAEIRVSQKRRELENPTDLEMARMRVRESEFSLLSSQLHLEWRLSLNKEYSKLNDTIENKKDKLQADIARLDVDRAQQHLDAAESTYRLILSQQQLIYIRHSHRVPSIKPINTDQQRNYYNG